MKINVRRAGLFSFCASQKKQCISNFHFSQAFLFFLPLPPPSLSVRYDSHKSCKFILAFEGASHTSPHRLPLNLATEILGTYNKSDGRGRNVAAKMC